MNRYSRACVGGRRRRRSRRSGRSHGSQWWMRGGRGLRHARVASGAFVLMVVALAVLSPLFQVDLAAQTPPDPANFQGCMRTSVNEIVEDTADGVGAGEVPAITLEDPIAALRNGINCAHAFADAVVAPQGRAILNGLSIIMVVWTGVMIMFSGRFDFSQILNFVFLLGFAHMLMAGFDRDNNIWGDRTFPELIYTQGEYVAEAVMGGTRQMIITQIGEFFRTTIGTALVGAIPMLNLLNAIQSSVEGGGNDSGGVSVSGVVWGYVSRGIAAFLFPIIQTMQSILQGTFFLILAIACLIPVIVLYASYLWAYVGIMTAVIIGPLFIPWMLVPQLEWLFWGWVKSLLKLAVHLMIAAVLFSICAQLALIPLARATAQTQVGNELLADGNLGLASIGMMLLDPFVSLLSYIPILILMWLACGKTGEMTAMVTEGTSMPGSGFAGLASQAAGIVGKSGGGQALAGGAGKLAGAAAGGVAGVAVAAGAAVASAVGSIFKR